VLGLDCPRDDTRGVRILALDAALVAGGRELEETPLIERRLIRPANNAEGKQVVHRPTSPLRGHLLASDLQSPRNGQRVEIQVDRAVSIRVGDAHASPVALLTAFSDREDGHWGIRFLSCHGGFPFNEVSASVRRDVLIEIDAGSAVELKAFLGGELLTRSRDGL
jgi:hypothetical protein